MAVTNLPLQLTSFIGRERELTDIERLVSTSRLVTLTGAGGCGKTRLATEAVRHISDRFADGVWLVDLVPLRESELVPQHVSQTLGLSSGPNQAVMEHLLTSVRPKQMLLMLDNCEHLIAACDHLVQQLLVGGASLRILVTSRQPLGLAGEMIYPVQGLACPSFDSAKTWDPQEVIKWDSVRLFVERARAISPHFTVTPANSPAIVEICCRLDGIPLALELASARVNALTPGQIAARLDDRFALLTSGPSSAGLPHHQTLRAAIDWSHDLLTPTEKVLLRRLSVFRAGFTLDTAEGVCAGDGVTREQFLDLLSSLVIQSLVVADTAERAEARYRLLETVREYALEKLREAGEVARLRDRHLEFFVARAEEIAPKLQSRSYQVLWLNWLDGELDNMRASMDWALQRGQIALGLQMADALFEYWSSRGSMQEGRNWLERLLAQADEHIPILLRARGTLHAGLMAGFLGDLTGAQVLGQKALALCDVAGEAALPLLPTAQAPIAVAAMVAGDFATAYYIVGRSVQLYRKLGDDFELIMSLATQGLAAVALGRYPVARTLLDEALSIARHVGNTHRIGLVLNGLGQLDYYEENYARAQSLHEESLLILRQIGGTREEPRVVHSLAHVHLRQGHFDKAHALTRESLALYKSNGNPAGMAECLIGFAALALERGMPADATRLLTAAVTHGRSIPLSLLQTKGREYDYYLGVARAQLTEDEFEQAQKQGRADTLDQAVEYALSLPLAPEDSVAKAKVEIDNLTAREREVAALIGQGKSNGEISAQLVLSKRTVEKHVANILSKLGLDNRAQIVRWAIEHGLTAASE